MKSQDNGNRLWLSSLAKRLEWSAYDEAERTRLLTWRFKILQQAAEVPRNVARTCRYVGISRKTYYKWKRRYAEHGETGLCDRPRAPLRSPRSTPREVVSKILYLRQTYHFGPRRIADYLQRFHAISLATSSVHRILCRHGLLYVVK